MTRPTWTYMLRILRRNPDRIPMDRMGEYIRQFAELLGSDNRPIFKGIKKASTGIKAVVPSERRQHAHLRLIEAKTQPTSRAARCLSIIEDMLGEDAIKEAQLLDEASNVIYLFSGHLDQAEPAIRVHQAGSVDGVVTGLVGADETMHLHLRDHAARDLKILVRDENLARDLLKRFRHGMVRLHVHGLWVRTEDGWVPEANRCTADGFEVLEDTPLSTIFAGLSEISGNGWATQDDPMGYWKTLRGIG